MQSRMVKQLLIPLLFLLFAVLCAFVIYTHFHRKSNTVASIVDTPTETVMISDHFSGEVYFNNEFDQNEFSRVIISAINGAKKRIDVVVYSMDHTLIRDALYRAADRGVKVTLLLSKNRASTHNKIFTDLPPNIERIDVGSVNTSTSGYMHHKFVLIDRGEPGAKLLFGSYNFTLLQEKYDPSFLMETTRPELIQIFGTEFDRIHTSAISRATDPLLSRNPFAAHIIYPEGYIDIWFTPSVSSGKQNLFTYFLNLIRNAQKNIEVMIWQMTDKNIAKALVSKAKTGIPIRILTDDYNFSLKDSAFPYLLEQKKIYNLNTLEVLTDYRRNIEVEKKYGEKNLNSFLHHHLMLIDGQTALFGTNNWSTNGFFNNDESIMVSNIPYIFSSFKAAFDANYAKAE